MYEKHGLEAELKEPSENRIQNSCAPGIDKHRLLGIPAEAFKKNMIIWGSCA
jgi:hypothetical protein